MSNSLHSNLIFQYFQLFTFLHISFYFEFNFFYLFVDFSYSVNLFLWMICFGRVLVPSSKIVIPYEKLPCKGESYRFSGSKIFSKIDRPISCYFIIGNFLIFILILKTRRLFHKTGGKARLTCAKSPNSCGGLIPPASLPWRSRIWTSFLEFFQVG